MKQKFFFILFITISVSAVFGQVNPCDEFNELNTKVRDGLISRDEARNEIRTLLPKIKEYFSQNGGTEISDKDWVFPLRGYTSVSIGGVNGSGYKSKGYDYFDGNKHGGHPAHDIFIHDRNQDNIDDITGKPVDVLSVSNGVVVACEPDWVPESDLRGGKYIYIYDPSYEGIFYYAHNSKIFVKPGDIVQAGDKIAECGRTGLNAYKKRSPTHLHLMFLQVEDGYPKPENIYNELLNAKTK
jgi:murein DD-endopeptidase MepM/ murein hydrolase activator NlpD